MAMALSDDELDRYARHLVLREIGGVGQAKIRAAKVLIVGAGGLGSPVALYLAAAGVGVIAGEDDAFVGGLGALVWLCDGRLSAGLISSDLVG